MEVSTAPASSFYPNSLVFDRCPSAEFHLLVYPFHMSEPSNSSTIGSGGGGSGSGGGWGDDGHTSSSKMFAPGTLGFWMLIAAASALGIAIAAMIVGSRRRAAEQYHPLKGVLERRMKMFGGMAAVCYEDRELCGAQREDVMENEMAGVDPKNEYKQMV